MTEIDRLPRIELRHLAPLFSRMKAMKGTLLDALDRHPGRCAEVIAIAEEGLRAEVRIPGEDLRFIIQAKVNGLAEIKSFIFSWEYDGEEKKAEVCLSSRPSNLVEGAACCYFICPETYRICRKLYTDGERLVSRYGFPHTYSDRNLSHSLRELKRLL